MNISSECIYLHRVRNQFFLKRRKRIENLGEISNSLDTLNSLFINISRLLKQRLTNVIVCQETPLFANLICKLSEAGSDDGIGVQSLDLVRVFCDKVAELLPQLVLRFAVAGVEIVVVHDV